MKWYPCPHFNDKDNHDLDHGIVADVGTGDDGESLVIGLCPRCADIVRAHVLKDLIQPAITKAVKDWGKNIKWDTKL